MTPAEMAEEIARLYERLAALERERIKLDDEETQIRERMAALKGELRPHLRGLERSATVQGVTKAQRRGRAIAKSRAAEGKDPRRVAIAARWGSQARAAKAAGISPALLVGYLAGDYPVPKRVAKFFAVDPELPATRATWPKDVTD